MIDGKLVWLQEEVSKRRYQYCSDHSGTILYLRALQGHSGNNLIDPMLQDNVVIGTGIFPYIYHVGCTFNLHSIINNGLVAGGQNLSRRQTVFFLPVDPRDESHRDPERIDFSVPRLARYVHSAITIGLEGLFNRVLQLNNSQLESSFNSLLEKHLVLNLPTPPNPNPIQSVIDRANLWTQNVFLWRNEKRPVHKRLLVSVCKKNLVLQIEPGNP